MVQSRARQTLIQAYFKGFPTLGQEADQPTNSGLPPIPCAPSRPGSVSLPPEPFVTAGIEPSSGIAIPGMGLPELLGELNGPRQLFTSRFGEPH